MRKLFYNLLIFCTLLTQSGPFVTHAVANSFDSSSTQTSHNSLDANHTIATPIHHYDALGSKQNHTPKAHQSPQYDPTKYHYDDPQVLNAPESAGTRSVRVMTEGEVQAVIKTGKLRGGNPGETYFTKDLYKSASKVQQRLALSTKPTHRLEFRIKNNPRMKRNGTKVKPDFNQPGKGSEFMTIDPVEVEILNIQRLNK